MMTEENRVYTERWGYREASIGLRSIKVPEWCCGGKKTEVFIHQSGPHLGAYCPDCRRYLKNMSAKNVLGVPREPIVPDVFQPVLMLTLSRVISDRGVIEEVTGSMMAETLAHVEITRRSAWKGLEYPSLSACCFPHESLWSEVSETVND